LVPQTKAGRLFKPEKGRREGRKLTYSLRKRKKDLLGDGRKIFLWRQEREKNGERRR